MVIPTMATTVRAGRAAMTTLSRTGALGRAPARTTIASVNRFKPLHTSTPLSAPITPPPPPSPSASTPLTSAPPRSNVSSRPTKVTSKPLPNVPNTLPILLTSVILALLSWTGFTIYATNKEKLSSSIFKSVLSTVKTSPEISTLFSSSSGPVVLKRETWLGGQPRIQGAVNMMQGRVDLAFQIHPQGQEEKTATVYFTSIRETKHSPFEIVRFVVVEDGTGKVVSLLESGGFRSIDVESGDIV